MAGSGPARHAEPGRQLWGRCGLRPPREPLWVWQIYLSPRGWNGRQMPLPLLSPPPPHPGAPAPRGLRASGPQGLARFLIPPPRAPFPYLCRALTSEVSFPGFSPPQPCWRAREIVLAVISRLLRQARALRGQPPRRPLRISRVLPPHHSRQMEGLLLIGPISVGTSKQKC